MASTARIDELRKKFEENPRRYFAPLANEYRKAGDIEQAISICQEHLPQQPGHMSGHIVYGQALFEAKRLDEARTVFETALALDPENLIALRQLGDIARELGDTADACIWYQRVLDADPRNDEIAEVLKSLQQATAGLASETAATAQAGGESAPAAAGEESTLFSDLGADLPAELDQPEPASVEQEKLTLDGEPPTADTAQPPSREPPARESSSEPLEGFEATQHPHAEVPGHGSDVAPGSELDEIDALFDADVGTETPSQPSQAPPAAFVTETMAELYLRQGHREEAIEVYRQLVAQRSDNTLLRQRLAELERQTPASEAPAQRAVAIERTDAAPVVTESPTTDPSSTEAASPEGGPTIRELLGAIAQRRPAVPPPAPADVEPISPAPEDATEEPAPSPPASDDSFGDFASESLAWSSRTELMVEAVADMPADTRAPEPALEPERQESVSGSLDALFVGAGAVEDHDAVGSAVDQDYGDTASHETAGGQPLDQEAPKAPATEESALQGKPAHRASDELSLDHVFKEPGAGAGADSAFSFDQFFADSANDSAGGPSGATGGGSAGGGAGTQDQSLAPPAPGVSSAPMPDDIEQFNAWLEGLKKT